MHGEERKKEKACVINSKPMFENTTNQGCRTQTVSTKMYLHLHLLIECRFFQSKTINNRSYFVYNTSYLYYVAQPIMIY